MPVIVARAGQRAPYELDCGALDQLGNCCGREGLLVYGDFRPRKNPLPLPREVCVGIVDSVSTPRNREVDLQFFFPFEALVRVQRVSGQIALPATFVFPVDIRPDTLDSLGFGQCYSWLR